MKTDTILFHIMFTYILGTAKSFTYLSSSIKSTTKTTIRKMTNQITLPDYGTPSFGITRKLPGVSFEKAVEETKTALKKSGFGVITEIDMKATFKNKLDQEIEPYVILGACQPKLAYQALQFSPAIGLLLPCNIVVSVDREGAYVSAVDPVSLFKLVEDKDLKPVAEQVQALLKTAIYSI